MKLSTRGRQAIIGFEGRHKLRADGRYEAYKCPAGVWTIYTGVTEGVHAGMIVTEAEGEAIFARELAKFETAVNNAVLVPLTQAQFDVLVSFSYNVGTGALRRSTLLRVLNAGDYGAVPAQLARWTHGGGKVLPGLVKRRAAEAKMWSEQGDAVEPVEEPMAQKVEPIGGQTMWPEIILGVARHFVTAFAGGAAVSTGGDLTSPMTWGGVAVFAAGVGMSVFEKVRASGRTDVLAVINETLETIHDRLDERAGRNASER